MKRVITYLAIIIIGATAIWYLQSITVRAQGIIKGTTVTPGEINFDQIICAERITDRREKYCLNVPGRRGTFSLWLPVGDYYVFSVLKSDPNGKRAYYNKFVTCGMFPRCTDTAPIKVSVRTDKIITRIRPHDWYH